MPKRWRKVLYENQGFPDNYTDKEAFLRDLQKNVNFKEVVLFEAVLGTTVLLQEICTVVGFVLIYVYLYNKWIEPQAVFTVSSILTSGGYIIYRLYFTSKTMELLRHDIRTVLIFLVFGQLFSPVLHTLTDTISTDTIYTMTFFMMLIHLTFFDYGLNAAIVSKSLSFNAAIFGSVCLASRLASAYSAFILLTVAVECFILFPFLRFKLQKSLIITFALLISVFYCLLIISTNIAVIFMLLVLCINIICPILFIKYQKYKENIYGPWDEAVVDDFDRAIFN